MQTTETHPRIYNARIGKYVVPYMKHVNIENVLLDTLAPSSSSSYVCGAPAALILPSYTSQVMYQKAYITPSTNDKNKIRIYNITRCMQASSQRYPPNPIHMEYTNIVFLSKTPHTAHSTSNTSDRLSSGVSSYTPAPAASSLCPPELKNEKCINA